MKSNNKYFFLILGLLVALAGCKKSDSSPIDQPPSVEYNDGILTCDGCTSFSRSLAMNDDNLWVADLKNVFWMIPERGSWKQQQKLHFDDPVRNLTIHDNTLLVSLLEANGVGKVKVFEKLGERYTEIQELTANKDEDNFGHALAIDGDHLIIGADAPFAIVYPVPEPNIDTGYVHFYHREAGLWRFEGSFQSIDTRADDRFGSSVAIEGNSAYAGSNGVDGLHIYVYDGQTWSLQRRWMDTRFGRAGGLAADEGRLMIRNHYVNRQPINIFELQEGIPINSQNVEFDFNGGGNEPTSGGRNVQLRGIYAAVGMERTEEDPLGQVILIEFTEGQWRVKDQFSSPEGGSTRFANNFAFTEYWLAIGDDSVYIGSGSGSGRVVLFPLNL